MASPPHSIHGAAQTVIFKIEGDKLICKEYLTRSHLQTTGTGRRSVHKKE
jgi:hypothetical protein